MQKEAATCNSDINVSTREVHFEDNALFMLSVR